jgi:hypothetical protein
MILREIIIEKSMQNHFKAKMDKDHLKYYFNLKHLIFDH